MQANARQKMRLVWYYPRTRVLRSKATTKSLQEDQPEPVGRKQSKNLAALLETVGSSDNSETDRPLDGGFLTNSFPRAGALIPWPLLSDLQGPVSWRACSRTRALKTTSTPKRQLGRRAVCLGSICR
jgi:hypothetical protein